MQTPLRFFFLLLLRFRTDTVCSSCCFSFPVHTNMHRQTCPCHSAFSSRQFDHNAPLLPFHPPGVSLFCFLKSTFPIPACDEQITVYYALRLHCVVPSLCAVSVMNPAPLSSMSLLFPHEFLCAEDLVLAHSKSPNYFWRCHIFISALEQEQF